MKQKTKWIGIGGLKCSCCVWKESKQNARKELRRKAKQNLKKTIDKEAS